MEKNGAMIVNHTALPEASARAYDYKTAAMVTIYAKQTKDQRLVGARKR
jgi:hypothetical protein